MASREIAPRHPLSTVIGSYSGRLNSLPATQQVSGKHLSSSQPRVGLWHNSTVRPRHEGGSSIASGHAIDRPIRNLCC